MKLAIIGFGHMGAAIVSGAVRARVISPNEVAVCDALPAARDRAEALGCVSFNRPQEAVKDAETVIIAVKPNNLKDLAEEIRGSVPPSAVLVSICAGKRLETLETLFAPGAKIVRVMPNTPAIVGAGMSALCKNSKVTDSEMSRVTEIFSSFGKARAVPEELFDAVTAVSGSGPAYVYSFIIALTDYAESCGMSYEDAKTFAAQTTLGAAKLALESSEPTLTLKQNICTPGGTTVEAVKVLDERGFENILKDAAKACEEKSRLLGRS